MLNVDSGIMRTRAYQIYLTEAEHAALQAEAERRGASMTAVVRELIEEHLLKNQPAPTDLSELIGAVSSANPTDIAADRHRLLYEDLRADLDRHERPLRVAESQ